jgi:hypothetical protein
MVGVIGGVFLLLAALLATLALVGKKSESGYPKVKYTLVPPTTLVDGRFELASDDSTNEGWWLERHSRYHWNAEGVHGVAAKYHANPKTGDDGEVDVAAMYGRFKNVDEVRARELADGELDDADKVKVLTPPQDFTFANSRIKVGCEEVNDSYDDGTALTYPVCVWADGNTWARVMYMTDATIHDVDLRSLAGMTLRIRSEMLLPAG